MNDDSGDDDDTHNDGGLNVGHLHTIKYLSIFLFN